MTRLPALAIRRPVATTMLYVAIVLVGLVSWRRLPVDLLPPIELTQLTIRVSYPNVGPEEIEKLLVDPIENAVAGTPNLERVVSVAEEGIGRVRLELARGSNVDEAANDVRAALDRIRDDLPEEASAPEIFKLDLDRSEVVSLAATSTRPLTDLTRQLEEEIARRFEQIPGVGSIQLRGGIRREIRIELDRDRLAAAGLDALDVQRALGAASATVAGGTVRRGLGDLAIRAAGELASLGEIRRTVVAVRDGLPVHVEDVATVRDAFEDVRSLVEINGVPSVALGIQKQSGANTVEVAEAVSAEVERLNAERDDLHLTVLTDESELIRASIQSVQSSAIWGSLLAIAVLQLFLRHRPSTGIVAAAIPIAVVSSFGLLYFGGLTLNQMTFGGLALGVGLIVDNAIVVLESIVRKREEQGLSAARAAARGAGEVAGAIVASTATTCVVFLPVVLARTTSGALFQALALVVVFALACSLLVALTLVPMLAARLRATPNTHAAGTWLSRLEEWYLRRLRAALRHRGRVLAATAIAFALALVGASLLPVELAPQTEADEIDVELELDSGTSMPVARERLAELEAGVLGALTPRDVDLVSTEVRPGDAEIELSVASRERRRIPGAELADELRTTLDGTIPGAALRVRAQPGLWVLRRVFSSGSGEEPVELELSLWDLDRADRLAEEIRRRMEQVPGVVDARVSRREGRREEVLRFDRDRIAALGLTVGDVARTVQANVGGLRAGSLRVEGDEIPIVVRLAPDDRLLAADLAGITLRTPAGATVSLASLAEGRRGRGPTEIERVDGQRVTRISAGLESGVALGDAVAAIERELADLALPPGATLAFGGEYREQQAARRDFAVAIVLALALVYMLMAALFERYVDPLVVMLSVPVALIGVVPMLLLTGTTINVQSVMGLVILVGIVVNNAIVLVDAVNWQRREERRGTTEAVLEAARLRLRPILMTTATTVLGLAPLALGLGAGAEIQAPLARVVIGGLLASTLVTLVLIPVAYTLAAAWLVRRKTGRWAGEDEEPAAGARQSNAIA